MTTEDQEYNDFMIEATKKVSELQLKYNMLSKNNQKRFTDHVLSMFRIFEAKDLFDQMHKLFNTGIN